MALAYQAIFGVPVHELFPLDYRNAVAAVQARADQLSRNVARRPDGGKAMFKQKLLASASAETPVSLSYQHERKSN